MLRLKSRVRGEYFTTQLWWVIAVLKVTCLSPIYVVNGLLSVRSRWCGETWNVIAAADKPQGKNADLTSIIKIIRRNNGNNNNNNTVESQ